MIIVSTDRNLLDRAFIHAFITQTYWAPGRTREQMDTCIDNSLNFGMYLDGQQIGYARVVSDRFQFAYLMDVFVDPAYRGNGYSKQLMAFILDSEELKAVKMWRLATSDAHGLYEQFGFRPLKHPEKMMELHR